MAHPESTRLLSAVASRNDVDSQILRKQDVNSADGAVLERTPKTSSDNESQLKRIISRHSDSVPRAATGFKQGWVKLAHFIHSVWTKSWTAEAFSYGFSILSLAGLIATLMVHQNKPLPDWPQLVTINSVVSLFSLLMRASISVVLAEGISQSRWQWFRKQRKLSDAEYFDSASRGPWGSIVLLCNMRPRRTYYIAGLGALATIMTALTGFFSQQLLQFSGCPQRAETATVTLAKTNNYTVSGRTAGVVEAYDQYEPLVAAATVGLIQPINDYTSVLTGGCDSGNCTFPSTTNGASFSTLAISHVCEDISSLIRRHNRTGEFPSMMVVLGSGAGKMTLAEGGHIVLATSTNTTSYAGHEHGYFGTVTLLFKPSVQSTAFSAVNCTLYPSVNTYSVNITNTVMTETLIDSIPLEISFSGEIDGAMPFEEDNGTGFYFFRMTVNDTLRNGVRESCTGSKDPTPGWTRLWKTTSDYVDERGYLQKTSVFWYYPPDCIWAIGRGATRGIGRQLTSTFNDQEIFAQKIVITTGSMELRALFKAEERHDPYSMDILKGRISFDSIDEAFKNMTNAMTVFIRTHGEEGLDGYVKGEVWTTATCVYVRWEWIMFPVAMIGLTGIFLFLIVIDNWGNDSGRLWKSSILATLFCEVDVQQERPVGKEQMAEFARSTSVSLEGKTKALKLTAR